jgi:hypothetical protein
MFHPEDESSMLIQKVCKFLRHNSLHIPWKSILHKMMGFEKVRWRIYGPKKEEVMELRENHTWRRFVL